MHSPIRHAAAFAAALLLSAGLAPAASADGPPAGPNPVAVQLNVYWTQPGWRAHCPATPAKAPRPD
ncbi:hypothetical protein ACFYXH_21695 [Streptomyces sp. NPDC002730]|uniref:hypothetical protein n=1 Tax=Streptomyces sp. NPDC002730 TaxID=3364662 RepID=UPI0036A207F1